MSRPVNPLARWPIGVMAALTVLVVAYGLGLVDLPDRPGPVAQPRPDSPVPGTYHVRLSGVEYAIPREYWDGLLDPGLDQDSILLQGLHPGFVAPTPEQWTALLHQRGHGNAILVLVTAGPFRNPPMRSRWETRWRSRGPFVEVDPIYGFSRYVTPPPHTDEGFELYRTPGSQMAEDIIFCYAINSGPSPGCEHFFMIDGSVAKVSFSRQFLPYARQIRRDVEAFFEAARERLDQDPIQPVNP